MACVLSGTALAAEAQGPPKPGPGSDKELSEVLVEGERNRPAHPGFKEYQATFDWLARLVGTFVIDGEVDVPVANAGTEQRSVSGSAECVGFGAAPGVQCEWKIRWPGSTEATSEDIPWEVSNLDPATLLYGMERRTSRVSWILVDSRGVAELAQGEMLTADTMRSRVKCGAIQGDCYRITRITAWPTLETIDVDMSVEIDGQKAAGTRFVMHRVPGVPSIVYGRKVGKEKKK
jgi:hypothetical protein